MKKSHNIEAIEKQMLADINNNLFVDASDHEFTAFKKEAEAGSKTRQISLTFKASDLDRVEARAKSQGFKYQSVIKALVHQYATGKITLAP